MFIKNFVNSFYTPKAEDFEKEGYLTPQQFVQAGDLLATRFGWRWEKAINSKLTSKNFPENKQYLSINGRSTQRIHNIMKQVLKEEIIDGCVTVSDGSETK